MLSRYFSLKVFREFEYTYPLFFFSPKNAIAEAKSAREAGEASGTAFSIAYANARDKILKQKPFVPTLTKKGEVLNYKQVATMVGEGTGQQQEALRQYQKEEISKEDFAKQIGLSLNKDGEFVKGAEVSTKKIAQFSQGIQSTGVALQSFGNILQGTPLAPFGKLVSTTGMLLSNFGVLIAKAATTANTRLPSSIFPVVMDFDLSLIDYCPATRETVPGFIP